MANLIITVIAIALVAVASLMGAYYGGAALSNNASSSNAATLINIGVQIAGAWNSYKADNFNVSPTDWSNLTGGNSPYLTSVTIPAMAGNIPSYSLPVINMDSDGSYWLWITVGHASNGNPAIDPNAATCLKIIKTATGKSVLTPNSMLFGSTGVGDMTAPGNGNQVFGCIQWSGGTTNYVNSVGNYNAAPPLNTDFAFFYRLQ